VLQRYCGSSPRGNLETGRRTRSLELAPQPGCVVMAGNRRQAREDGARDRRPAQSRDTSGSSTVSIRPVPPQDEKARRHDRGTAASQGVSRARGGRCWSGRAVRRSGTEGGLNLVPREVGFVGFMTRRASYSVRARAAYAPVFPGRYGLVSVRHSREGKFGRVWPGLGENRQFTGLGPCSLPAGSITALESMRECSGLRQMSRTAGRACLAGVQAG